jgi:NADH:ubiquinone oxidoreductase subunit E
MISFIVGLALATAAETATPTEVATAQEWVKLIDQRRFNESWDAAGKFFQSQISQASWTAAVQPVREPLGTVESRNLKSVTKATSLPGAPNGDYRIVQFATKYASKKDATETVVLACDATQCKVDGYFIR